MIETTNSATKKKSEKEHKKGYCKRCKI